MLFNSFLFLIFFPSVCLVYFLLPFRLRNLFLLAASYYFYMNWEPVYAVLILISTGITWLSGILMERWHRRKLILTLSLVSNLGILFLFKYYNFINESVFQLFRLWGIRWEIQGLNWLLPVGISFYTFQAIGYTIDVYRRTLAAERNFLTYALFVSFFPQLVAGPIERAANLLPQFKAKHPFQPEEMVGGLRLMLWGMFMKVVVADRISQYVDAVYNNYTEHSGSSLLLATVLFAIQIYCDFGGYSLVAIGAAKVMGFRLMENFRRPYFASSVTDFWRRWHISLSTWFKDYVYIPLGGNRVGRCRHYFNLLVTFLVSGLWHGANWTFVIWGGLHGMFQVVEKTVRVRFWGKAFFTFLLVDFAWIFFRSANMGQACTVIHKIATDATGPLFIHKTVLMYVFIGVSVLMLHDVLKEYYQSALERMMKYRGMRWGIYLSLILLILAIGVFDGGQFIYFQF